MVRDVFEEMMRFDAMLFEPQIPFTFSQNVTLEMNLRDLCQEFNYTSDEDEEEPPLTKCFTTGRPIDFLYVKETDSFKVADYPSDGHLLFKVRTGKGDPEIYTTFYNLPVDRIFGGTYPEEVEQDFMTGENDILYAKVATYTMFLDQTRNPELTDEFYELYE